MRFIPEVAFAVTEAMPLLLLCVTALVKRGLEFAGQFKQALGNMFVVDFFHEVLESVVKFRIRGWWRF